MNDPEKILVIAHRLYHLLLVICHSEFRQRYEWEMGQVFRDRCRESWQRGGLAGLVWWWISALVDLAGTAIATHVDAFAQGEVEMKRVLQITMQVIFGCGGILLLCYTMIKRPMPHWEAGILLCGVIALLSVALCLQSASAFRAKGQMRK